MGDWAEQGMPKEHPMRRVCREEAFRPISATQDANRPLVGEDPWKTLYRAIPEDAYKLLCEFEDRLGKLYGTGPFPEHGRSDLRFKDRFANTYRFAMLRISELSDEDFKRIFE